MSAVVNWFFSCAWVSLGPRPAVAVLGTLGALCMVLFLLKRKCCRRTRLERRRFRRKAERIRPTSDLQKAAESADGLHADVDDELEGRRQDLDISLR